MATPGKSAAMNGDKLLIETVQPAFPQSLPVLGRQGGTAPLTGLGEGDLLIRQGFQVAGQGADKTV